MQGEVKKDQEISECDGENPLSLTAINSKSLHNKRASESQYVSWSFQAVFNTVGSQQEKK